MSIENRPYVGTWQMGNRKVVRHTPDALVYVNGVTSLPGCPTCGGRIDLQQYITTVSVDPSTQPEGTCSISLAIPRSSSQAMFVDGQFVLQTGMEINVYFRGYFPVTGMFDNVTQDMSQGIDISSSVLYPYYHVFHGVVTEVSHEYSGGEHTASMTCMDMLHFWANTQMASQGSVFGERPKNSKIRHSMVGNNFTAMTPYSIIYTLYRDVMGAAGGVGFALSSKSNVAAESSLSFGSMWAMAQLYWEKRFSQHFNNLRMFGMDGSLYNAYEQAFLGRLSTAQTDQLIKQFSNPNFGRGEKDPMSDLAKTARALEWDAASVYSGAASERDAAAGGLGLNVNQLQAFVSDVSNWANINYWETEYQTKLQIVSTLTDLTGFEFYQDVDGDFVFKPPFYNLDTSSSRVYVIEDIDIITFTVSHEEPQATAIKATSSQGKNIEYGLGGEWGNRAMYIDYRLVAQYGWRQEEFETAYLSDPRAMYFACMNRMDLLNIRIKNASCQIPLRPELRPGYPVYIRHLDCFFYIQSMNHSFTFGGQCTTTLTLVAQRSKFHAPGKPPEDGNPPTVDNIDLSNPWLAPLPLSMSEEGKPPRLQGFPNVVLGVDPALMNPAFFFVGFSVTDLTVEGQIQALVRTCHNFRILELDETNATGYTEKEKWLNGPWLLRTGDETTIQIPDANTMLSQVSNLQTAQQELAEAEGAKKPNPNTILKKQEAVAAAEEQTTAIQALIDAGRAFRNSAIGDANEMANYFDALLDLKASFSPGTSSTGHYRYYSASHPDMEQQGMRDIVADQEVQDTTQSGGLIKLDETFKVFGFQNVDGQNEMAENTVEYGLPLMRPNTGSENARAVPTPTHQIGTVAIAQHWAKKEITVTRQTGMQNPNFAPDKLSTILYARYRERAQAYGFGATVRLCFEDEFNQVKADIEETTSGAEFSTVTLETFDEAIVRLMARKRTPVDPDAAFMPQFSTEAVGIDNIAKGLAGIQAKETATFYSTEYKAIVANYGRPGHDDDGGTLHKTAEDKETKYYDFNVMWFNTVGALAEDEDAEVIGDDGEGLIVEVVDFKDTPIHTPVFPVSDERGYEVYGAYRYGRGLSIEPGGSLSKLMAKERFANVSVAAAEAFVESILNTGNVSKALGDLATQNPEAAAEMAVAAYGDSGLSSETVLQIALWGTGIAGEDGYFAAQFSNFLTTNKEFTQKANPTNAAYGLADMGLGSQSEVCECKGAEADVLLMAFADDFLVSVDQPDEVHNWLADQMLESGESWHQQQKALRGEVLDAGSSTLVDQAQAIGSSFANLQSGMEQATNTNLGEPSELTQAQTDYLTGLNDLIAAQVAREVNEEE